MRLLLICLTAFLSASFIVIDKEETEHQNVFIGKKLSETPYGNYVKEDLTGDNFIVIVKFDCDLCIDGTNESIKLREASLLKNLIVLGSGFDKTMASDSLQTWFTKQITSDVKIYNFDSSYETFYKKLFELDPKYPESKHAIYVKDNIIKRIFVKIPTAKQFEKIVKE